MRLTILFLLMVFQGNVSAQIQYLNLHLTKTVNTNIKISGESHISWGAIDVEHQDSEQILLHEVEKDSSATIYLNMEDALGNDVYVGFSEQDSTAYYGFLFREDTCYARNDTGNVFLMKYMLTDSLVVIKCNNNIQLYLVDSLLFDYELDTFLHDFDVVAQIFEAPLSPNLKLAYFYGGDCIVPPQPPAQFPTYISLNKQLNKSYAVVDKDFLHIRYREKYNITPENTMASMKIYAEDDPVMQKAHELLENRYGNNFHSVDLTPYPLTEGHYYILKLEGTNKNSIFYLRFKR